MNVVQIEGLYIYNGDSMVKNFKNDQDFRSGLSFLTDYGFNAVGVNYKNVDGLPCSIDILVRHDGDSSFSISDSFREKQSFFENSRLEVSEGFKNLLSLS